MRHQIILVLPNVTAGGAERVMLNLFAKLKHDQFEVSIVVLCKPEQKLSWFEEHENLTNLNSSRVSFSIFRLRSFLAKFPKKLVISSHVHVNILLLLLSIFEKNMLVIIREANMPVDCLKFGHWPQYYGLLYRILLPRAMKIIVSSRKMASQFKTHFRVNSEKLSLINNPIDVELIRKSASTDSQQRMVGRNFIAVGKLSRQKRFDRLIEMMTAMERDDRLIIIGSGPEEAILLRMIRSSNLTDRVELLGQVDNPWQFISRADALLLPSQWEGMPNVALEALALGVPVIAYRSCGGLVEVVEDVRDGMLFISNNKNHFLQNMQNIQKCENRIMRKNQLPESFHSENVFAKFSAILGQSLGG